MKNLLICFAVMAALFFGCKKDEAPTIYGDWLTINSVGFLWEYHIQEDGLFCRTLPQFHPTLICNEYVQSGDTIRVNTPTPEVWVWRWECENVASVQIWQDSVLITAVLAKR